ncbi:hypothetical protein FA10DRAFT_266876 [Acaromyces ingoldii]|uniref:Chalcone isomerase domain-containing protein n=1 Tax=Acaromyces ingoldii TaxID=215250 RepID=A0A316YMK9_9BASI|nr:hypothetical protein FA10DRAFT_266876 [Acaromyces ingoldii]PWN90392.1 hypothetical protein FA10DRAFT_266876 [Acaromyces ingoldii]
MATPLFRIGGRALAERLTPLRGSALRCQARTFTSSGSSQAAPRARLTPAFIAVAATTAVLAASAYAARPLHLEAPPASAKELPTSLPTSGGKEVRLDPSTKQPFPTKLEKPATSLPFSCGDLVLVGLGVRTVSFLRVQVYVAGLYIDERALKRLEQVPGWKGYQKDWLLDQKQGPSGEQLVAALVDQGVACVIRIVPVRSTDFAHLRDGFTRSIQARAKQARKAKALSDVAEQSLSTSLQALKDAFPRASLPKGQALDLVFAPQSSAVSKLLPGSIAGVSLTLEQEGKILGTVHAPGGSEEEKKFSVARQLMLAYLADKDEISRPFKQSVAEGFESYVNLA